MFIQKRLILCLSALCFLFSSCFEVVEDVSVKKDGSGTMKLILNFSQSKTKVAAIMMMDSIQGHKVPDRSEIEEQVAAAADWLKTMKGLSNVTHKVDFDHYVATVSFAFRNVSDVNNIARKLLDEYKVKTKLTATYNYDQEHARFSRDYNYSAELKEQFNKLKERDREVLRSAAYISIFRFEQTISNFTNQAAKVSKNQLAIMQRFPVADLISGKADLSNQIQLSR